MRARQWAGIPAAFLMIGSISACTSDGEAEAADSTTPPPTSQPEESATPAADEPMDDADLCSAYGDVLTILENADLALDSGRMDIQEHEGWYALATRVLDRLPATGTSEVSEAIADLQSIAPAVAPGASGDIGGVRSSDWDDAEESLGSACEGLDTPLTISVFSGG